MHINFTGQNIDVTPALQAIVEKKAQRIFKYFDENIIKVDVVFKVEKLRHLIEMRIFSGKEIVAQAEDDESMYKAIDKMMAKIERQIKKIKEKEGNHRS